MTRIVTKFRRGIPVATTDVGLLWRRTVIMVPIIMISIYNLYDVTVQNDVHIRDLLESENPAEPEELPPKIDIMSVGSVLKAAYQDAQQRTFGSHSFVRNFFRVTEMSDTDRDCFTELTTDQIDDIIDFCGVTEGESFISGIFRNVLFQPKKHAGWMCAQKRPVDGLHHILNEYKAGMEIPDYLFIIDDDTYMNIDSVTELLLKDFPVEAPHVTAGCNFEFINKDAGITFPYGGFGSFLTKAAIKRLLQPINCSTLNENGQVSDPFSILACFRLQLDAMGEKRFFEDGMSVGDLMYNFAAVQPFSDVKNWKSGYCFHSDHALAYFINFYHISVPDERLPLPGGKISDRLRKRFKYSALTNEVGRGRRGECSNERERCKVNNHICHYIQPDQMDALYREKQELLNPEAAAAKHLADDALQKTEKRN